MDRKTIHHAEALAADDKCRTSTKVSRQAPGLFCPDAWPLSFANDAAPTAVAGVSIAALAAIVGATDHELDRSLTLRVVLQHRRLPPL